LKILVVLAVAESAHFTFLARMANLTRGNLSGCPETDDSVRRLVINR